MTIIKEVKRDTSKDTYLENLKEALMMLKKIKNKAVKDAEKECNTHLNSCNMINEKFDAAMQELGDDCVRASEIPHYEEHIFRKDNYEMSQEEYGQLCEVLQEICENDCENIATIYQEYGNAVEQLNDAWHHYSEVDLDCKDFENCYETFGKKCKRIKK